MATLALLRRKSSRSGLVYLESGNEASKRAVLCIHGWACQGSDYTYILQKLADDDSQHLFLAPFLPGHGDSPMSLCPTPSMPGFAKVLVDFITELELESVILLGHSMGTRVILELWSQLQNIHPGSVKGLVLLDGSHARLRSANRFEKIDRQGATGAADIFMEMFSPATPTSFRESTREHLLSRDQDYSTGLRKAYMQWDYDHNDETIARVGGRGIAVLQIQSTDVDGLNRRNRLRQGDFPTYMEYVRANIPAVKQIIVEDAGHFPHIDQKETVAEFVRSFITETF